MSHLGVLLSLQAALSIGGQDELIVGDSSLLQSVRDALTTNAAAFPKGRIVAEAQLNSNVAIVVHAEISWDGDDTHWHYDLSSRNRDGTGTPTDQSGIEMLEKSEDFYFYQANATFLQRIPDKSRGYHRILRLRPDQLWFNLNGDRQRAFHKYIDPEWNRHNLLALNVEYEREDAKNEVVIRRQYASGGMVTIVTSLDHGNNIVRYARDTAPNPPPGTHSYGSTGELAWEPVGDGRFYLKSYKWSEFSNPDDPFMTYEMTVESFDANPVFPPDQFTLAGLDVAPGTIVEDLGPPERTYRYGREPVLLKDEELEKLAAQQRNRGFAEPDREVRP